LHFAFSHAWLKAYMQPDPSMMNSPKHKEEIQETNILNAILENHFMIK